MIRRAGLIGCFIMLCSILGLIGFGYAQNLDVMDLPPMTAPVVDYSNTLTSEQLNQLNHITVGLQSGHQGAQVTTVIIPDRQGYELFDIGMKIADDNQIGQDGLDTKYSPKSNSKIIRNTSILVHNSYYLKGDLLL